VDGETLSRERALKGLGKEGSRQATTLIAMSYQAHVLVADDV
jgi:hypothetical protein